jgi:hypothetical protein
MTTFDERERAYEARFARDEELRFRAATRRDRMIGLWAAGHLGMIGDEAETYARAVVRADLAERGDEEVFRKIRADFDAAGVPIGDDDIRRTMREMLVAAADQLTRE